MKSYYRYFLTFAIFLILNIDQIASLGKLYKSADQKKYYIENEQEYSWYDALQKCVSMNMSLATIETKVKSDDINKLVKDTFGGVVRLWIGGAAVGEYKNGFIWISSGKPLSYTYWSDGNPDFSLGNEYCVQIGWGANMEWNDQNCLGKFGFVCEYNRQDEKQQDLKEELQKQAQVHSELKLKMQKVEQDLQKETQNRLQLLEELKQEKQRKLKMEPGLTEKGEFEELKRELLTQKQQQEDLRQEVQRQQKIQQGVISQTELLKLLEKQQELQHSFYQQLQQHIPLQEDYNKVGNGGKCRGITLNIKNN